MSCNILVNYGTLKDCFATIISFATVTCNLKVIFATVTFRFAAINVTRRSASLHTHLMNCFATYVNDFIEIGFATHSNDLIKLASWKMASLLSSSTSRVTT